MSIFRVFSGRGPVGWSFMSSKVRRSGLVEFTTETCLYCVLSLKQFIHKGGSPRECKNTSKYEVLHESMKSRLERLWLDSVTNRWGNGVPL